MTTPITTPVDLRTADRRRQAPPQVLLVVSLLCVLALAGIAVALVVDDQVITGSPAWLKPAKFAVSIAVYCATLAAMLRLVEGHRRTVAVLAWTTGGALLGELVLIAVQAGRGTTSHFNDATPFDAAVFSVMGGLIAAVFLAAVVVAVLLVRQRGLPAPLNAGLRGGLVVCLLGMAEAGLMLANRTGGTSGGHTVGAPDGGPGLPLTGWSTEFGDLRVAHFVGLHALQLLPLVAWLIARWAPGLTDRTANRLMTVLSVGYGGFVVLLAWQAMRELPLLRPDALVTTVAVGWSLAVLGAVAAVLRGADLPVGRSRS